MIQQYKAILYKEATSIYSYHDLTLKVQQMGFDSVLLLKAYDDVFINPFIYSDSSFFTNAEK